MKTYGVIMAGATQDAAIALSADNNHRASSQEKKRYIFGHLRKSHYLCTR